MTVKIPKKLPEKKPMKARYVDDVVMLPLPKGLDVFTGKGWEQWSRFDCANGYPKLVAGKIISEQAYSKVHNAVCGGK